LEHYDVMMQKNRFIVFEPVLETNCSKEPIRRDESVGLSITELCKIRNFSNRRIYNAVKKSAHMQMYENSRFIYKA